MDRPPELTLAVIGCGRPYKTDGSTGFGMSNSHMKGYRLCENVRPVALCDVREDNAQLFRDRNDLPADLPIYADYHHMLADVRPDLVTIATWPHLHAPMVIAAAEAGAKAVHCEKPMALTFGDATRMVGVCERTGTQLSFGHQRRFNPATRRARELLEQGAIGALRRVEATTGNLFDWGTHCFDLFFFFNGDAPAEWVIGQIDVRGTQWIFDGPCEGQGLSHFRFANDVYGTLKTGHQRDKSVGDFLLTGADGQIAIPSLDRPDVKVWARGSGEWQTHGTADAWPTDGPDAVALSVVDVVESLRAGREPQTSGRRALRTTELIFGSYESARRRGRIDLPLAIDDSPLQAMLDEAGLKPTANVDRT